MSDAEPTHARQPWAPWRVVAGMAVFGLVVGAVGWVALAAEPELAVIEAGVSEATAVRSGRSEDVLSWAAVVGNPGDRTAVAPVLQTRVVRLDALAPGATIGVGGTVEADVVGPVRAADVRLVPDCVHAWRDADEGQEALAVDVLEVGVTADNAPLLHYRATSSYDEPVEERRVTLVLRDADGEIVGGEDGLVTDSVDEPLDPGGRVTEHYDAITVMDGVAAIDVYASPDLRSSASCAR